MRTAVRNAVAVAVAVIAASGCGGSSSGGSSGSGGHTLNVFAAASLVNAFGSLVKTYEHEHAGWTVKLNLAGSDQLAAQIEQGAPADVFAAASPKYPEELQSKHLLGTTQSFATNTLVLVTPKSNPAHIMAIHDITKGGKMVVADPAVPLGAYTETVLASLGIDESQLHVVSKEQDAESVLAKVTLGEADTGFVYVTDALSQRSKLREIQLPAAAQATATYPIGTLTSTTNGKAATQWIDLVTGRQGQAVLKAYGFGPPPSS